MLANTWNFPIYDIVNGESVTKFVKTGISIRAQTAKLELQGIPSFPFYFALHRNIPTGMA